MSMKESSNMQLSEHTAGPRRSRRVRRSVVTTTYDPDSSDMEEEVPRKHPIGRCSSEKQKCSAVEQEKQIQQPTLVTNGYEMPPEETIDGIPVVEIPSSPEEEKPKRDLLLLRKDALKPNPQEEPGKMQLSEHTAGLSRSARVRRSVVTTTYDSDSSDIEEEVPRKHPIGRCSSKKQKCSAVEQEKQLHEPTLVTDDPEMPIKETRDGLPVVEYPSSPEEEKPRCHEMPPGETRDGVPAVELPSLPEQEKPMGHDLRPHNINTKFSSSGKVEYAITNFVAFLEKESVQEDFHPLMDFLKNSPFGYALTASPIIYAEVVEEMWSKADCSTRNEIKLRIKGKSYILTSSLINEALHLPNSNFENMPTKDEIQSMLIAIKYASSPWRLSEINKKCFRKEWSHFFDTLNRVFAGKSGSYHSINILVLRIAYSLIYGRRIDIGRLLLTEFSNKLYMVNRSKVIYYARFLMIIANHLCKELIVENRDDTLQVCAQEKKLFSRLVKGNQHAEVEFVLPEHIQVQLSTLYSVPVPTTMQDVREESTSTAQGELQTQSQSGTKATSSVSQSGERKITTLDTITEDGNESSSEENGKATEVHPLKKKRDASKRKSARNLLVVDEEMPPAETNNVLSAAEPPPHPEEEKPKLDLLFLLEPARKPKDCQHLMNAASVLKSQLVARLIDNADKVSTEDMIILADQCYNTLRKLGDNSTFFKTEVNKVIAQHRELTLAAEKKENLNGRDIKECYVQQAELLSDAAKKLSSAQYTLSRTKSGAASLKLKIEELTSELLKLEEELSKERERVKALTAEMDECKEAIPAVESELRKLVAEKEAARMAFEAINARYCADKNEFEKMSNHLLQFLKNQ